MGKLDGKTVKEVTERAINKGKEGLKAGRRQQA